MCFPEWTAKFRMRADKKKELPASLANASVQIGIGIEHYWVAIQQISLSIKKQEDGEEVLYQFQGFGPHWPSHWWNGLNAENLIANVSCQKFFNLKLIKYNFN